MSIVTRLFDAISTNLSSNCDFNLLLDSYLNPCTYEVGVPDYGRLIQGLAYLTKEIQLNFLRNLFELMDKRFRESENRIKYFYVKQTRKRTIITIFGEVTYLRESVNLSV